ncbi:MAG: HEAT repeat domain-containing protein [Planctomycetota bacterium]
MESKGPEPTKTPASYADFTDAEQSGGWLKTAVQFFAIPMLIVLLAVGVYLGVRMVVGGGATSSADFVEMLKSDTVTRRWHAAFELAARLKDDIPEEFRSQEMIDALCSALDKARTERADPPRMAVLTLSILSRLNDPRAIPAVREAMEDAHPWTRSHAIRTLAQMGDRESLSRMREFATNDDAGTRQVAIYAVAMLEQTAGVPFHLSASTRDLIKTALGDREEDVRFTAALLLAKVDEREAALPVLKTMLDRSYLEKLVPASEMDQRMSGISQYDLHSQLIRKAMHAVELLDCGDDPEVVALVRKLTGTEYEGDADVRERARQLLAQWNQGA